MRPIDLYFLEKEEPARGCLLYLRNHITGFDVGITEEWKYRMPMYCYKGKCYAIYGRIRKQVNLI